MSDPANLQVDKHIAFENHVVEHEVDVVIATVPAKMTLPAHGCVAFAKLKQEFLQVRKQSALER